MKTVLATTVALFCGIFFLFLQQGSSIQCYECNSRNDANCALDKPPDSLKIHCLHNKSEGSKYTMCRKIVQNIDFEVNGNKPDTRVIRTCAWDDSSYKGSCYQRSGFGGRQEVCSCLTDFCNGAALHEISYFAAFIAGAFLLARFNA